ncbi:uncharacterized protein TNCV_3843191 [Trichonephila clavipes]|nr:uncharacterized protein TNCV_3843191 [Trichonephila clavipes]
MNNTVAKSPIPRISKKGFTLCNSTPSTGRVRWLQIRLTSWTKRFSIADRDSDRSRISPVRIPQSSRSPSRFLYRERDLTRTPSKIQSPSRWRGFTTAPSNSQSLSGALVPLVIPLSNHPSHLFLLSPLSVSAPLTSCPSATSVGLNSSPAQRAPMSRCTLYVFRRAVVTESWHHWYQCSRPGGSLAHGFTRQDQTLLARFQSGHIKSMKFSEGRKSFEMCTDCSSEPSTPAHILECLGLTKQDLAGIPLLVLDFLKVYDGMDLV